MPHSPMLADVITLDGIRSLTDPGMFARGAVYFRENAVSCLVEQDGILRATVRGTHQYAARLEATDNGELRYNCDCPVGEGGAFCKHAVAVALLWLDTTGKQVVHLGDTEPIESTKKRKTSEEEIRDYVATLNQDSLRALVLETVERDDSLRSRLLFAARLANNVDLASMKVAVRQATRISGTLDWREASAYGESLTFLAILLRERLAGPHASQVVELSELAIACAEKSLEQIDDSSGDVMPAITQLASVHLDACLQTRPEAIKLAGRLFRLQTEGPWDTFLSVLPSYREALGEGGLQRYRELVEKAWDEQPALVFESERSQRQWPEPRRMRLEHAMEALARLDGNVDALIHVHAKDLSHPMRFLQLAELCLQHGREEEALQWSERGLAASGRNPDQRLLDFSVTLYTRIGDFARAEALAWQRFTLRPVSEGFAALMKVAQVAGKREEMREQALAHLWSRVKKEELVQQQKDSRWLAPTRTELVRLFLAEKNDEEAWNAYEGGPVSSSIWETLAAARGKTHPRDAIALYHRLLPIAVESGTGKARYDRGFVIVRAIARLRAIHGEQAEFANELDSIRTAYKAKRNFIKLLETFQ